MKLKKTILENRWLFHLIVFGTSFLILFSRRPDALLNPQFWAEDGKIWFAQAYNQGVLVSLTTTEGGYFQTLSRLVADLGQFVPLLYAPLLFVLVALTIKILFVNILVSDRCAKLIPNLAIRFLIGFVYLCLPGSYETHANLTNAQWNLALLACFVIFAEPSEKIFWKIFDVAVVTLSAVSGPLCLFLLPVTVIVWWCGKNPWKLKLLFLLSVGVLIQAYSLIFLTGSVRRLSTGLGAAPGLFFKIIGGQIFLSSLIGQAGYSKIVNDYEWTPLWACMVIIVGCLPLASAVWKGSLELRLFLLFAGLIACGALVSPVVTSEKPQWEELWLPFAANRYWLIPIFGFLLSVIFTSVKARNFYLRGTAILLLLILPLGIYKDWKFAPYKDFYFADEVRKFEESANGAEVKIPINPDWKMILIKK